MKISNLENPLIGHTLDSSPYHNKSPEGDQFITKEIAKNFERILSKYPKNQAQSALMSMLLLSQVYNGGHINEKIIKEIAEFINIEPIAVTEVASFYSMFNHQPTGKYQLCLCKGVSCLLNGYQETKQKILDRLAVDLNEITSDGMFSVKEVECLGACNGAPVIMVGDQYYENCNPENTSDLLDQLRLVENK